METRLEALTRILGLNRRLEISGDSIRVVREIEDRGRWIVAAEFVGHGPLTATPRRRRTTTYQGLYALRPTEFRWHLAGSSIGARGASTGRSTVWSRMGGFTSTGFGSVRGGWVAHPDGSRVRLIDDSGRSVDAQIESGVALLSWSAEDFSDPVRTELLDGEGRLLAADLVRSRSAS